MASVIDSVVNLAKRRGLVYPCGEIYGGTRSAWDYGPLGVELKENIKRQWWRSVVTGREDVVGLDSSTILPREVGWPPVTSRCFTIRWWSACSAISGTARTTCRRRTSKRRGRKRASRTPSRSR